ncbi:uncharacterized protein LOC108995522 isoform X3 [Juglans regia]|uniref:Uncharacterized protein LOC108995522 isoform X3 n=1 Tax=Juglans regia TaxID=51240 RepID=A0A6P9EMD7_JUGRE|nr:uncharacterized protein LOC108995522 isoform X3 [Juglans regia]
MHADETRNQDHADCGRDTVRSPGFPSHSRRTETTDDEPARREPVASLSPSRHLSRCAGKASVMMDLITLFSELVATFIILVTRPFSLFKLACFFAMKTVFILIHTWMELVRATFGFHVNLFSRIIMLTVTLISLPARILNALKRERQICGSYSVQLELYLNDIQIELENLEWDRKELGDDLQIAIKECKMMELILAEVEEEHDKAIAKIEQLEGEFQDLKNENLRLKEIKDEGYWSIKGPDDMGNGQNTGISESSGIPCGISSWKSSYNGSGIFLQDPMMSKDTWVDEGVMDPRLTCSRSHSPECTKRREEE